MARIEYKLPHGWVEIGLHELMADTASINPKNTPTKMFELWSVPSFEYNVPEYVTGVEVGSNKQKVSPGDVLLCKINPRINRVWLVKDKGEFDQIASTEWLVLRSRALYPPFLLYQLREENFRQRLLVDLSGIGGSLTRARPRIVRQLKAKLAPGNEQKRIIARIEELQTRSRRAKEALESVPDLLEQLYQSILAAAFRGDLTKEWREKHPNVEPASDLLKRIHTERRKRWEEAEREKLKAKGLHGDKLNEEFAKRRKKYKDPAPVDTSDLLELPNGWRWASFDQLTENYDSRRIPLEKSIRNKRKGNFEYYGASGVIDWINEYIFDGSYLLIAEDGANLLSRSTPIAFQANGKFWVNNHAHVVQTLCGQPLDYLEYYFNSIDLEPYITGSAQPKLKQEKLNSIPIPIAPLEEQLHLSQFIEEIFKYIKHTLEKVELMIKSLSICNQSILSKAFRGELVPQDPKDEPASVLLERIRQEKAREAAQPKAKDKQKGMKMKNKLVEQRNVIAVLRKSGQALTPEEVFSAAGFDEASVDTFYEQLRESIAAKQVRELREGETIRLEAIAS
ncbi:MAG: restriction endonuclease subunit S [Syntrophales bacterium]